MTPGGFWAFMARVLSNDSRNRFYIRLGSKLILAKFGLVGIPGKVVDFFLRGVLGVLSESGIFIIDVALDAYREGQKLEEFKIEAAKAYIKATDGVKTEDEKNEIRQQYLKIISDIGFVGKRK